MQAQRPLILTISFLAVLGWTALAFGQRGMGEPRGVAQQADKPAIQTLRGTVQKVITEECVNTTGRYRIGTHFILKTEDGKRNVHLGPAAVSPVKTAAEALSEGQTVTVKAFRTERMPKGHYNAQQIETSDQTLVLRDDTLRPAWAGQRGISRGTRGVQRDMGRANRGPGCAMGRFDGRRPGRCIGRANRGPGGPEARFDRPMRGQRCPMWRQGQRPVAPRFDRFDRAEPQPRMDRPFRGRRGNAGIQRGRGMGPGRGMASGRRMMNRPGPMMGPKAVAEANRNHATPDDVRERRIQRLEKRIDQLQQRLEQLKQDD